MCLGGFYLLSRELVRSVDGWMDSFLVQSTLPLNVGEDIMVAALSMSNMVPVHKIASSSEYVFRYNRQEDGAEVVGRFLSMRTDRQRACTLAMHPIKNVSRLKAVDALWESTTKKLPGFFN